jgi:hypothetical protein
MSEDNQQFPNFIKLQKGENVLPLTGSNAPLSTELAEALRRVAENKRTWQDDAWDRYDSVEIPNPVDDDPNFRSEMWAQPEAFNRDIWQELHEKRAKYFNSDDPAAGAS